MEHQTMDVTPNEVLDVHRAGQRSGFIAGVIFCIGARYLWLKQRRIKEYKSQGFIKS